MKHIYIREGESVKNTKPDARALVIKTPFILYAIDSKLTWRVSSYVTFSNLKYVNEVTDNYPFHFPIFQEMILF